MKRKRILAVVAVAAIIGVGIFMDVKKYKM